MGRILQTWVISLAFTCLSISSIPAIAKLYRVGYWPAYSYPYFRTSWLHVHLYTHLSYAFADLNPDTFEVIISAHNHQGIADFARLGEAASILGSKLLLSIGGGNANNDDFSTMAASSPLRKKFIDSSIYVARYYGLHGLDLYWAYPETPEDMKNLGLLFDEWKIAVKEEARISSKNPLLITAAVYYSNGIINEKGGETREYPIGSIRRNLDWVNIMSYNFTSPNRSNNTGLHAVLFSPGSQFTTSHGIQSWVRAGLPKNKIVMGMAMYGYSWTLKSAENVGIGAEASGPGNPDVFTFAQIQDFIKDNNATEISDDLGSYCYAGVVWIGYDNEQSVKAKVEYFNYKNYLGYFFWNVVGDSNWNLSNAAKHSASWRFDHDVNGENLFLS